jgi:hypothetical protein
MFYIISMEICEYDAFAIAFSSFTCYDTVSYYDTSLISVIINWCTISAFCLHEMHDTAYDISIVASLSYFVQIRFALPSKLSQLSVVAWEH